MLLQGDKRVQPAERDADEAAGQPAGQGKLVPEGVRQEDREAGQEGVRMRGQKREGQGQFVPDQEGTGPCQGQTGAELLQLNTEKESPALRVLRLGV